MYEPSSIQTADMAYDGAFPTTGPETQEGSRCKVHTSLAPHGLHKFALSLVSPIHGQVGYYQGKVSLCVHMSPVIPIVIDYLFLCAL